MSVITTFVFNELRLPNSYGLKIVTAFDSTEPATLLNWATECKALQIKAKALSEEMFGYSDSVGGYDMFFMFFATRAEMLEFRLVL